MIIWCLYSVCSIRLDCLPQSTCCPIRHCRWGPQGRKVVQRNKKKRQKKNCRALNGTPKKGRKKGKKKNKFGFLSFELYSEKRERKKQSTIYFTILEPIFRHSEYSASLSLPLILDCFSFWLFCFSPTFSLDCTLISSVTLFFTLSVSCFVVVLQFQVSLSLSLSLSL